MSAVSRTIGLVRSLVIYYGQPWKRRRMDALYAQYVRPGDLCFDIGAHVGNRIAAFRRLGARVVAVEPQPACLDVLNRMYGDLPDVKIVPLGCGSAPGRLELRISRRTPTVTSFDPEWIDRVSQIPGFAGVSWDELHPVDITTLDALIEQHGEPAFAKIDVEGFELDVLRGLSRPLRGLSFEVLPAAADRALACVERLESLARQGGGRYRYRVSIGETHRLGDPLDEGGLRAWLGSLRPNDRSGDVYAALEPAAG
jgi:FkbM family methyltransferase